MWWGPRWGDSMMPQWWRRSWDGAEVKAGEDSWNSSVFSLQLNAAEKRASGECKDRQVREGMSKTVEIFWEFPESWHSAGQIEQLHNLRDEESGGQAGERYSEEWEDLGNWIVNSGRIKRVDRSEGIHAQTTCPLSLHGVHPIQHKRQLSHHLNLTKFKTYWLRMKELWRPLLVRVSTRNAKVVSGSRRIGWREEILHCGQPLLQSGIITTCCCVVQIQLGRKVIQSTAISYACRFHQHFLTSMISPKINNLT